MKKVISTMIICITIISFLGRSWAEDIAVDASAPLAENSTTSPDENAAVFQDSSEKAANVSASSDTKQEITSDPKQISLMTIATVGGGQPFKSAENFQVEPTSGTATLTIPLDVPPGRKGIQPNLVLMYNSSSPNGIAGVGWNLDLGSIQRSTKKGVPTYNDAQDNFVLAQQGSTQELVSIGGNQYRAKIEGAFMKFEYSGASGWVVTDKKGIKYYFGETFSSQQGEGSRIFKWCLDKVEDLNGNYMIINYSKDQNQIYPWTIQYTYHTSNPGYYFALTEFNYEARNDSILSYRSGFPVTTAKRLSGVVVKAENNIQRSYRLNYRYSSSSPRSLLTSITQYGADGQTTLPPTTFNYQTISNQWMQQSSWNIPMELQFGHWRQNRGFFVDEGVRLADVNSDGLTDMIKYKNDPEKGVYINNKANGWYLDSGWNLPNGLSFVGDRDCYVVDHGVRLADVNADGFVDLLQHFAGTSTTLNQIYLNNKSNGWVLSSLTMPSGMQFITDHSGGGACDGWYENMGVLLEDVNADGFVDIIKAGNERRAFLNNNGNGWTESSVWVPPSGVDFSDGSHILADVNADGLPDIVKARNGDRRTYLNTGAGWAYDASWNMPVGDFERGYTQLVDINGDGLADIVIANADTGTRQAYLNNGHGWDLNNTWSASLSAHYIDLLDGRTRFLDADGDGLVDLMRHFNNEGGALYINDGLSSDNFTDLLKRVDNGIGATTEVTYFPSTQYDNTGGDNISDLPFPVQTVKQTVVTNQVSGQAYSTTYEYRGGLFDFAEREFRGFAWLKSGQNRLKNGSFEYWSAGPNNPPDNWSNAGNISSSRESTLVKDGRYSLKATTTSGGYVTYNFTGNTSFRNKHLAFGCWVNISQPDAVRMVVHDGIQSFYSNGHSGNGTWQWLSGNGVVSPASPGLEVHFEVSRANTTVYFDGAVLVEGTVIDDQSYIETIFLQDAVFKGRISTQAIYDASGSLFNRVSNTWQSQDLGNGAKFVYLGKADNFMYDGNVTGRRTQAQYFYEEGQQYGNLTRTLELGEVALNSGEDIGTDQRTTLIEYTNNSSLWLLGLPKRSSLQDKDGVTVKKSEFYYDNHTGLDDLPTKGNLTKQVDWLNGAINPSATFAYDDYGNLFSSTDANNRTTSTTYDLTYHLFPLVVTNALGHQATSQYYGVNGVPLDDGAGYRGLWGQLKSVQDPNAKTVAKVYDTFGRTVATISPLDSVNYPTTSVEYDLSTIPIKITTHQREVSGQAGTLDTLQFYDGLGRLIETKTESENSNQQIISNITEYNSKGLPIKKYFPYFTPSTPGFTPPDYSSPFTFMVYDCLGRVIETTNPDDSFANIVYDDWQVESIDENGHRQAAYYDAYGRLLKKEEFTGADGRSPHYPQTGYALYATTLYTYDTTGNLIKTEDNDHNITTITYDTLGRKISMTDPDMGYWQYFYDAVGNLIRQIDNQNQTIQFQYDVLNRLTVKSYPASTFTSVTYTYDDVAVTNSKGRLTKSVYKSNGNTSFAYDALGRETQSVKKIDNVNYTVTRTYDAANRITTLKYPDNALVTYTYNFGGQVESVSSGINNYVASVDYTASGQISRIVYGNGVTTNYTYDPNTLRLTHLVTKDRNSLSLQDLSYQFDEAGNVLSITNNLNSASQTFSYDALNRLINASGTYYGNKTYAYDKIGNMTAKDGIAYVYGAGAAGPHALTSASDGSVFTYDLNGNLVRQSRNGLTLNAYLYDLENRLSKTSKDGKVRATFNYDGDGGRTKKTAYIYKSGSGLNAPGVKASTIPTIYVGNLFEKTNSVVTRHIFLGAQRVCSLFSGAPVYLHPDHLGSSNLISDQNGIAIQRLEYDPYGTIVLNEGQNKTDYKFTGKELDEETGLYFFGARYYNPSLGRFITPDPTIQKPFDPQDLNRYTYCRNNPINLTDPTGLGWKKFWSKLWNAIEKPFIAAVTAAAVVFTWGAAAAGWTVAGGTSALFSTAGATIVGSASASTATLQTYEGQRFVRFMSYAVFDNVFGMDPRTAAIFGNIAAYMTVNAGFQFGFARLFGANKQITRLEDIDTSTEASEGAGVVQESNGVNYGIRPIIKEISSDKSVLSGFDKLLYSGDKTVGVAAEALKVGNNYQHLGIMLKGLKMHADMAAFSGHPIKAITQGYFTFGISHQAVNISLLNAGYQTTINSLLNGGWATAVSTFVYGPYGGSLIGAISYEKDKNR